MQETFHLHPGFDKERSNHITVEPTYIEIPSRHCTTIRHQLGTIIHLTVPVSSVWSEFKNNPCLSHMAAHDSQPVGPSTAHATHHPVANFPWRTGMPWAPVGAGNHLVGATSMLCVVYIIYTHSLKCALN